MKNNMLVIPHLGLGDQIICNGLVRNLSKNNSFDLVCDPRNIESVRFMYRDLLSVNVIEGYYDSARKLAQLYPFVVVVGDMGYGRVKEGLQFDEWFYSQVGVPFEKRWSDFYVERDEDREKSLFDFLNPMNEEYIFIHHDNRFRIDENELPGDVKWIFASPMITNNVFDYCSLIENAKEIHTIESSFMFLTDSINPKGQLFAHSYARQYPPDNAPHLKKEWTLIK